MLPHSNRVKPSSSVGSDEEKGEAYEVRAVELVGLDPDSSSPKRNPLCSLSVPVHKHLVVTLSPVDVSERS